MWKTAFIGGIVLPLLVPFANGLNLEDNFQQLTIAVPKICSEAYQKTFPSCTESDFQKGASCSSACVAGLQLISTGVNAACLTVVVDSSTLLGRIFQNLIVPSLCPNNAKSSSSARQSSTAKSTSSAQSTTSKQTQSQSSSAAASSATDTPSSSTTQSSSTSSSASSTSSALSASRGATLSSTTSSTSTSAPAQTPAPGGRFGKTVQQQQFEAVRKSGGGSPFDIVGYTASGNRLSQQDAGMITAVLALVWVGILLI